MYDLVYACLAVIVLCVAAMVVMVRYAVDAVSRCHKPDAAQQPQRAGRHVQAPAPAKAIPQTAPEQLVAMEPVETEVNMDALAAATEAGYAALMMEHGDSK